MELGKVPFGKLTGQELELFDQFGVGVATMKWKIPFPGVTKSTRPLPAILHETKTVKNCTSIADAPFFPNMHPSLETSNLIGKGGLFKAQSTAHLIQSARIEWL